MKQKIYGTILLFAVLSLLLVFGCGPTEEPALGTYRDGTVVAVSQANERGYVEVALTIQNDEIVDVDIVEFDGLGVAKLYEVYGEVFPQLEDAHNELAQSIIDQNTWDVDIVSGATSTSEKTRGAAMFALEKARQVQPTVQYFDGTFMATSDFTERGWGIAWVTIANDQLVDVTLAGTTPLQEDGEDVFDAAGRQVFTLKTDDYPWEPYHDAKDMIASEILRTQSPEVDTFTEATGSSNQWMQAVARAMENARTQ